MTVYASIMQGLREAVAYTEGYCEDAKVHLVSSDSSN